MKTLQFEGVKVALKQDKTGYVLTLNVHPDEVPIDLLRDFVGARYQIVMVRLNGEEKPLDRTTEYARDPVRAAGILCREAAFGEWLVEQGEILEASEREIVDWLKAQLGVASRSELRENPAAARRLWSIEQEYKLWNQNA